MSTGAVKRLTTNFGLNIINYDFPRWHTYEWQNWDVLDAVLAAANLTSVKGAWVNSAAYLIGDRVVDTTDNTIWLCAVAHTSAASGTFSADRTANSTYWSIVSSVPVYRGSWLTLTNYSTQDIVKNGNGYYLCSAAHTSGTFSTDLAANKWTLIIDLSDAITAVNEAETSATNALASENAAATSASDAATSAATASVAETNAVNSALLADNSATGAVIAQAAAASSASAASTSASNAATSASNAATSASSAATLYDNFDDRYLGAKATEPTVDNDGNALIVGALYFKSTSTQGMYVWDGTAWGPIGAGGGMFKGDNGTVGSRAGDIFRVTEQQLDTDTTIAGTENAHAPGPLTIASGKTLTISSGGNLVIT